MIVNQACSIKKPSNDCETGLNDQACSIRKPTNACETGLNDQALV